jgi:hypothetical protein
MKTTTNKATAMVVAFGHLSDARDYRASLRACSISFTVEGHDVVVALTTAENNEIARNLVERYLPTYARVFWR